MKHRMQETSEHKTGARRNALRLVCCALVFSAALISLPASFFTKTAAGEERISQSDIDKLESRISGLDKAMEEQEKKISEMQADLKTLENASASYAALARQYYEQIEEVNSRKEETAAAIADCEEQIRQANDRHEEIYKNYKATLRNLRESRDVSLLELIFRSSSLEELLSSVERAKDLAEYKRRIMEKMDGAFREIEKKKAEYQAVYEEQSAYAQTLETLRYSVLEKISQTENKLTALAQDVLKAEQTLKDIEDTTEAAQKELTALIKRYEAQLERDRLAKQTFLWPLDFPTNRRCTSPYGYRYHPISGTYKFHSGVDLAGPTSGVIMGDNIYAAMDGTVITAVVNRGKSGYGSYIVISHGYSERYKTNLSTLYGHCDSISVKVGDQVKQGQFIGKVGTTGASTGPHLHFEVRANGVTTDPFAYLYITKAGADPTDPYKFITKSY